MLKTGNVVVQWTQQQPACEMTWLYPKTKTGGSKQQIEDAEIVGCLFHLLVFNVLFMYCKSHEAKLELMARLLSQWVFRPTKSEFCILHCCHSVAFHRCRELILQYCPRDVSQGREHDRGKFGRQFQMQAACYRGWTRPNRNPFHEVFLGALAWPPLLPRISASCREARACIFLD